MKARQVEDMKVVWSCLRHGGGHAGKAEGARETGGDAVGHKEKGEVRLKVLCPRYPGRSRLKNGVSTGHFGLLASPTGFEPVLPP